MKKQVNSKKIGFEVQSRYTDGYETSILFECDEPKYAYLEAVSAARYAAWKHDAISSVNAFIFGDYENTVHCVFDCGLFGPIHWNYWNETFNW